jgi:hypothetical protein
MTLSILAGSFIFVLIQPACAREPALSSVQHRAMALDIVRWCADRKKEEFDIKKEHFRLKSS